LKRKIFGLIVAVILILSLTAIPVMADEPTPITVGAGEGFDFATIQAAIDDAGTVNGDIISVAAGTYTENVIVNKGVALQGEGAGVVTATTSNPAVSVFTVTVDNVEISGFTVTGANTATTAGIYISAGVANCNIHDNILTGNGDGLWLGAGSNHNTLANNIVSNNTWQGFEVYISDYNTFVGNTANSNPSYGFKIDSGTGNEYINNTANSNGKYGFYVVTGDGGGAIDTVFTNNTANLNTQYGIRINGGDGYTLTGNTFDANVLAGFRLKEDIINLTINGNIISNSPIGIDIDVSVADVTQLMVTNNSLIGNTVSVKNAGTGTLNAENNWWGNSSGNIVVDGDIDTQPWLLVQGGATYDATVALPDGWSLVSIDRGTVVAAWADVSLAYKYSGGFSEALATDVQPLNAVFVFTEDGSGLGINNVAVTPSTIYSNELTTGWNLISVISGIDTDAILSPLRYVTIGTQQGVGLSTLVNQGAYNPDTESFYVATLTDGNWDNLPELSQFDGYWAYMNAGKTFEVIP